MSKENVEIVRRALEANHSGDLDAQGEEERVARRAALWDPDCEYTSVMAALEPSTYHGHDGIRRYLTDLAKRWSEWRTEPEEVVELAPNRVFATLRFHAVGKDSGVPVEALLGSLFQLREGKLLRGHTYPNPEEALKAAGIER